MGGGFVMSQIFVLDDLSFISDYAFAMKDIKEKDEDTHFGKAATCKACGHIIGPLEWLPPFQIRLRKGVKTGKPGDVIYGSITGIIVSEKFREVWNKERLQGIEEFRPIEIVGKRIVTDIKFYYPKYKLPTAKPDLVKTKIVWTKQPPDCPVCMFSGKQAIIGIHLSLDTIPDDDLFRSLAFKEIFASERFKQVVESSGLTNIQLIPAEKYIWPDRLREKK
jgi:hypothetical protein